MVLIVASYSLRSCANDVNEQLRCQTEYVHAVCRFSPYYICTPRRIVMPKCVERGWRCIGCPRLSDSQQRLDAIPLQPCGFPFPAAPTVRLKSTDPLPMDCICTISNVMQICAVVRLRDAQCRGGSYKDATSSIGHVYDDLSFRQCQQPSLRPPKISPRLMLSLPYVHRCIRLTWRRQDLVDTSAGSY
jgi:hypothetical protein